MAQQWSKVEVLSADLSVPEGPMINRIWNIWGKSFMGHEIFRMDISRMKKENCKFVNWNEQD